MATPPAYLSRALLAQLLSDASGLPGTQAISLTIAHAAVAHGIAPVLHQVFAEAGPSDRCRDDARQVLAGERRATAARNLRNYAEFKRIALAMKAHDLPLMPLKGLHLAELVYGDISLRPMTDLDILVPEDRVPEAIQVLRSLGYGPETDNADAALAMIETTCALGFAHQVHGTWVEVHWRLSEPGDGFAAPMDDVWRTSAVAKLGGCNVQVMQPEYLLLHVAAHLACKHGFIFGVRALADVAEIVRAYPQLDWTAFVDRAKRHGWQRGVALALRLARDHLQADIPTEAMAAIGGDAVDPALRSAALEQMLAAPKLPGEVVCSPNFLNLAGRSPAGRVALLFSRIFAPRAELAMAYGIAPGSPWLPFYYVLRLRDLSRRYVHGTRELLRPGSELSRAAARRTRLAAWIAGT
jgi:hypothetical protein